MDVAARLFDDVSPVKNRQGFAHRNGELTGELFWRDVGGLGEDVLSSIASQIGERGVAPNCFKQNVPERVKLEVLKIYLDSATRSITGLLHFGDINLLRRWNVLKTFG